MTALEYAQKCWRQEGWGEPSDSSQEFYWTFFFAGQPPGEIYRPKSWTRPAAWVEVLIGGKRARRHRERVTVLVV